MRRSLRHHARAHLGVVLGAAVGSAVLIGALMVGDSVRGSMRALALERLGWVTAALAPADRFFTVELAQRLAGEAPTAAVLRLPASVTRQDQSARANQVHLLGVGTNFWAAGATPPNLERAEEAVWLNEALAAQLQARPGDEVVFRIHKPSVLSRDMPITPRADASVALRGTVAGVVPGTAGGNFSLQAGQTPPLNAFVPYARLARLAGLNGRANLLLAGGGTEPGVTDRLNARLKEVWRLEDLELELRTHPERKEVELISRRIFLDPAVTASRAAAEAQPVLTYLANLLTCGTNATPYSMVAAVGAPLAPDDLKPDEILVNEWLASDLHVGVGDRVGVQYFMPESGGRLVERTNQFRVRAVVPLSGRWADRTLMPEFPGLSKAESTHEWDAGFPLTHKIRDQDEQYWKQHRGTPKAYISSAAGQALWANRFGGLTALRWSAAGESLEAARTRLAGQLQRALAPADFGLRFEPERERALAAAGGGQDFSQLFLGFSFFLIAAALVLMALLFQLGWEQRMPEIGILLATGFTPAQVRRVLLAEGWALALAGSLLGTVGGWFYAQATLRGLTTIWRDAVGTTALSVHVTPVSVAIGLGSALAVCGGTVWLAMRRFARQPARELLAGSVRGDGGGEGDGSAGASPHRMRVRGWAAGATAAAMGLVGWASISGQRENAGVFFGAGSLLLGAGLSALTAWLRRQEHGSTTGFTLGALGLSGCARRRKRSLAVVTMLACGSFLVLSIGVFHLDENQGAARRESGTGGFALLGQSALPVVSDLNTEAGRDFHSLEARELADVTVVPFRVREGDDASCLNLNKAQKPRVLGVNPELLAGRFSLAMRPGDFKGTNLWELLGRPVGPGEVAVIGDAASIQWALKLKLGATLPYTDERGQTVRLKIVGGVANSVLQGNLVMAERDFLRLFPGESGHRFFLVEAPSGRAGAVAATLSRALRDSGLELLPAPRRLAQFNAVQNTYLGTFQVLGGLGLLLGSAGLAVVLLRNLQERRGELALLVAVGFTPARVRGLVLVEHAALLGLGLGLGLVAAGVAVAPAWLGRATALPWTSLGLTLLAVAASGLGWTWVAARWALRGELTANLRGE